MTDFDFYYTGGRGSGKTTKILEWLISEIDEGHDDVAYVGFAIDWSQELRRRFQSARMIGLRVYSPGDFARGNTHGCHFKAIGIDDLDLIDHRDLMRILHRADLERAILGGTEAG